MSNFAWVDPANTATISVVDFPPPQANRDPAQLITGQFVYLPKISVQLTALPQAQWDVYALVQATELPPGGRPPTYYTSTLTYAFRNAANTGPGVVGDDTSIVQQTRVYAEIPIADLYDAKSEEVRAQDQGVRYNAVDTALNANWWLIATQDARFELIGIQGNWLQRQIDGQGWPGGLNQPWVGVFNANTEDSRRVQVTNESPDFAWNTLYLELTQHDQATGNATDASREALDVAYDDGLGDWQAVADHDPADQAWGYPPTVTLTL